MSIIGRGGSAQCAGRVPGTGPAASRKCTGWAQGVLEPQVSGWFWSRALVQVTRAEEKKFAASESVDSAHRTHRLP